MYIQNSRSHCKRYLLQSLITPWIKENARKCRVFINLTFHFGIYKGTVEAFRVFRTLLCMCSTFLLPVLLLFLPFLRLSGEIQAQRCTEESWSSGDNQCGCVCVCVYLQFCTCREVQRGELVRWCSGGEHKFHLFSTPLPAHYCRRHISTIVFHRQDPPS